jgi:hypothetical protein
MDARSNCTVTGNSSIGGLIGSNWSGTVERCGTAGTVTGYDDVGGLLGYNSDGAVAGCYASGAVSADHGAGGLVAYNYAGTIENCYATGAVGSGFYAGGLVAHGSRGTIKHCYAAGLVVGDQYAGGLVGRDDDEIVASFWDTETSGLAIWHGGGGRTTAQMQTAGTFLEAGWDFVGEVENGTDEMWWILEGQDYPRLWWEANEVEFLVFGLER